MTPLSSGKMGSVTMTPTQFRHRLEALSTDDLEGFSDAPEDFGAELLNYCDCDEVADETVSTGVDLDHRCCCALRAITRGDALETVLGHITDAHSAAPGAREILNNLYRQWHTPAPA